MILGMSPKVFLLRVGETEERYWRATANGAGWLVRREVRVSVGTEVAAYTYDD